MRAPLRAKRSIGTQRRSAPRSHSADDPPTRRRTSTNYAHTSLDPRTPPSGSKSPEDAREAARVLLFGGAPSLSVRVMSVHALHRQASARRTGNPLPTLQRRTAERPRLLHERVGRRRRPSRAVTPGRPLPGRPSVVGRRLTIRLLAYNIRFLCCRLSSVVGGHA
jgi:hypothetical protein